MKGVTSAGRTQYYYSIFAESWSYYGVIVLRRPHETCVDRMACFACDLMCVFST